MDALTGLESVVAPLLRDNVDTDAIIPAPWLRSLAIDPGDGLFAGWRYRTDGSEDPAFVLNQADYRRAQILLARANFGCGSSRENAVWALASFGIRCVIARSFSDIFYENCFKNGLLPIVLSACDHAALAQRAAGAAYTVRVDVRSGSIGTHDGDELRFPLDERKRTMLLHGTDEIDQTLALAERIEAFRAAHRDAKPWLYPRGRDRR